MLIYEMELDQSDFSKEELREIHSRVFYSDEVLDHWIDVFDPETLPNLEEICCSESYKNVARSLIAVQTYFECSRIDQKRFKDFIFPTIHGCNPTKMLERQVKEFPKIIVKLMERVENYEKKQTTDLQKAILHVDRISVMLNKLDRNPIETEVKEIPDHLHKTLKPDMQQMEEKLTKVFYITENYVKLEEATQVKIGYHVPTKVCD